MSLLTSLLAPFWQWIAAAIAGLLAIAGIYLKGRSDAKAKAQLEDLRDANDIWKAGADARASVDASADGLRQSDGWKRD